MWDEEYRPMRRCHMLATCIHSCSVPNRISTFFVFACVVSPNIFVSLILSHSTYIHSCGIYNANLDGSLAKSLRICSYQQPNVFTGLLNLQQDFCIRPCNQPNTMHSLASILHWKQPNMPWMNYLSPVLPLQMPVLILIKILALESSGQLSPTGLDWRLFPYDCLRPYCPLSFQLSVRGIDSRMFLQLV